MAAKATAAKETTSVTNPLFSKLCADLNEKAPKESARPAKTQEKNKDLQKTRMCVFYLQGKCGLGPKCKFAHCESEIRQAPNLRKTGLCVNFMKGNCQKENCSFAHGESELVKPPSFKKAMCIWYRQGKCRNGNACGFVHDLAELQGEVEQAPQVKEKPWKSVVRPEDDDASTDAPSESQAETDSTDISAAEVKPMPEEHLFRVMAGRGSAPLDQQLKSMGLAIGQLQTKLAQVKARQEAVTDRAEGETLRNQMKELEYAIDKLSKQIKRTEAELLGEPMPPPTGKVQKVHSAPSRKVARSDCRTVKTSGKVTAKAPYQFQVRVAIGVFIVAAMVLVEMCLPK